MNLVLQNGQAGRRAGLSRNIGSSLLQNFNASASQNQTAMPPRAVTKGQTPGVKTDAVAKKVVEEELDHLRQPESEYESDEEYRKKSKEDIQSIEFPSAAEKPEEQQEKDIVNARGRKKGAAIASGNATANTRPKRGNVSPASSQSSQSPKRKSQEDGKELGAGMFDQYGRKNGKKIKTNTYGAKKAFRPPPINSDTSEDSPKKEYKKGPTIVESPVKPDAAGGSSSRHRKPSIEDSPATTPSSGAKFRPPVFTQTPDKEESVAQPVFKLRRVHADDSLQESNQDNSQPSLPEELQETTVEEAFLASQRPAYKAYNFDDDDLVGKAQSILHTENSQRPSTSAPVPDEDEDDDFQTMTQMAKCPMCGESVDPAELRAYGHMNTRKQEKFCRSHRRATALKTWDEEEYPTIDWAKLDSRISKHHPFIKELINGADSYSRDRLAETVNAGKNRSLLKSDFNPTPGYYGTRGLLAISENTMRKFTPLLKRRMVVDRLMAARGFTPYVEYVVVPEVAVKLIMDDMNCGPERAREIMTESLAVGELLSEEVRDIVTRRGSEEIEDTDE